MPIHNDRIAVFMEGFLGRCNAWARRRPCRFIRKTHDLFHQPSIYNNLKSLISTGSSHFSAKMVCLQLAIFNGVKHFDI